MKPNSAYHSDILVVGGGVIGLACAYYLARAGRTVRIIEQGAMGAGASHGNCGLLVFSDLPPLCAPGTVTDTLVRMLQGTSPLTIKPRLDLALARWLLQFAANCNRRHLQRAVVAREALLRTSEALFDALFRDEHLECDFEQRGVLMVFTDPSAMAKYAATNQILAPFGLAATRHDAHEVRRIEPALNERVCGAWFHRKDSHLRPDAFISAWSRAAQQRGVSILEKCRLLRFAFHNGQVVAARTTAGRFTADQFILATGAWSTDIVGQLGLRIPVQPGKGYSITMQRPAVCPTIPCYLYEKRVVVTPWQSGYRLGGTMEFSGFDDRLDEVRLANLVDAAQQYLRTPVGTPEYERWAGWRPMCADDLPIIDRVPPADNLYIATGHGMLGLTTATGTGRLLTDMVLGRRPPCDPEPFSLTRF